jgi:uncharacterized protein (TIGR02145 family)
MKILVLIIKSFLFLCVAVYSCGPNAKERTKRINEDSIKSINEKEQKGEIIWINESQGYFTDIRDSKRYKVVKIGTQTWFAENLAYKPVSGDFWAYDDNKNNIAKYGYLYFWETAKNVCPAGWHLPSIEEWNTLINFLGGRSKAGGRLKAAAGWKSPSQEASNSSGFSALPGGNRAVGGSFYHLGEDALFWSSTPEGSKSAWKIRLSCDHDSVGFEDSIRLTGRSVRCIMD